MKTYNMSFRNGKFRSSLAGLLFAAPAIIGVLLFQLVPIIYTFRLSMSEPGGFKLRGFVGFDNFISLFADKKFLNLSTLPSSFPTGALVTSIEWIIIGVPLVILVGLQINRDFNQL